MAREWKTKCDGRVHRLELRHLGAIVVQRWPVAKPTHWRWRWIVHDRPVEEGECEFGRAAEAVQMVALVSVRRRLRSDLDALDLVHAQGAQQMLVGGE
jgi:hypothetical protein